MYIAKITPPLEANLFDEQGQPLVKVGDEVAVRLTRTWAITVVAEVDVKHQRVRALNHRYYWEYQEMNAEGRAAYLHSDVVPFIWYNTSGLVLSPRTWKPLQRVPYQAGNLLRLTDEVKAEMVCCALRREIDDLLGDLNQFSLNAKDDEELNKLVALLEGVIQGTIRHREGGELKGDYPYLRRNHLRLAMQQESTAR